MRDCQKAWFFDEKPEGGKSTTTPRMHFTMQVKPVAFVLGESRLTMSPVSWLDPMEV